MKVSEIVDELGNTLYGMTSSKAIAQNICIKCKKPPHFKTKAGEEEYQLSGMCEYCFDKEFAELE